MENYAKIILLNDFFKRFMSDKQVYLMIISPHHSILYGRPWLIEFLILFKW